MTTHIDQHFPTPQIYQYDPRNSGRVSLLKIVRHFWRIWIPPVTYLIFLIVTVLMILIFGFNQSYSNYPIGCTTVAGMVVMNLLQYMITFTSASICSSVGAEVGNKWVRQIHISPATSTKQHLARVITILLSSLLTYVLILALAFAYKVSYPLHNLAFASGSILLSALFGAILGISIGLIIRSPQATNIISSFSWILCMFSGNFIPLENMGSFFQKVALFTPMWGLHELLMQSLEVTKNLDWRVYTNVGIYFGIFIFAVIFFKKWETRR